MWYSNYHKINNKRDDETIMDLKSIIFEYMEKYRTGKLENIIGYIAGRDLMPQKRVSDLKKDVRDILNSIENANYSETTNNFYYDTLSNKKKTTNSYTYKSNFNGTISLRKGEINFKSLKNALITKANPFGFINVSIHKGMSILNGTFKTDLTQANFSLSKRRIKTNGHKITSLNFNIISIIDGESNNQKEIMSLFINNNLLESIKRERTAFIPINFDIYLILNIIINDLKKKYKIDLEMDFINFHHK